MRVLPALALASLCGCVAYNDQCKPLVDNPDDPIGKLGQEVFMDRPNTRHANHVIGQKVADSFVDVFEGSSAPARIALVNGGSLRAEGVCVTRNILASGATLTRGLMAEILLFANIVQAVDLTEPEVFAVLEHSVERLFPQGTPISSPSGAFLQVSSELGLTVDCSLPPGSRVTSLRIGGTPLTRPGNASVKVRVAMSSFILAGNDGYSMLAGKGTDASRNPAQAQKLGGVDAAIAADYFKRTFDQGNRLITADPTPRITFVNCATPSRPSN